MKSIHTETWKKIPGLTRYEASTLGRIRLAPGAARLPYQRIQPGQILTPNPACGERYRSVSIQTDKGSKTMNAHRLIAKAFHGNPPTPLHQIHHRNGDGHDNRPSNLEWTTAKENIAQVTGRRPRLSRDVIVSIKKQIRAGLTNKEIASGFEVTAQQVSDIRNHRLFAAIGLN